MKGTLKKVSENEYSLFTDNKLNGVLTHKLSIKNCKAIENWYDLDELARNYVDEQPNDFLYTTDEYWNAQVDFQKGFQKAMGLMEDKKYSEMDLMKAFKDGKISIIKDNNITAHQYGKQQLKPKEWEVNIEVECCGNYTPCNINCEYGSRPKLDNNGCLILKRV